MSRGGGGGGGGGGGFDAIQKDLRAGWAHVLVQNVVSKRGRDAGEVCVGVCGCI